MTTNKFVALVDQIPVSQTARATVEIKRFLLRKVREIRERRGTIEQAAKQQTRNKILDGYKKAIGFEKMKKQMDELERKEKELKQKFIKSGLYLNGSLIDLGNKDADAEGNVTMWYENNMVTIPPETVRKIKEVNDLLEAVEGEMEPFGLFDQLETRMMMASSVGEAMAVVNAITGEQVFRIDYAELGLSSPGQKQLKNKGDN